MSLRARSKVIRRGLAGLALAVGAAVAAILFDLPDLHGQSTVPADPTTRPATLISPDAKPMDQAPATSSSDGDGDGDQSEPARQLVGQPAPVFSLTGLDSKPFKLSDQKGKVLILDFWATWCPPCREGLPILNQIAANRPNDVKVYAVNLQEDAPTVKSFLEQNHLSLPVLLDGDGKTAELYKATGIPETVVIGKDGVVRKVLVGLDPDEVNVLNAAIDAANK